MPNVFLTGSRVYGPITENSDIDVVMEKEDALQLLETIKTHKLDFEMFADYGDATSFKFFIFWFPPINIIITEDAVDWFKWKYATEKMRGLAPIIDREERIETFHKFQEEGFEIAMQEKGKKFLEERMNKACSVVGGFPINPGPFTGFVDEDITSSFMEKFMENTRECTVSMVKIPGADEFVVGKCPAAVTIAEAIDARELARNLDRIDDDYNDDDGIPF
ncbi:hypothetical protein E4G67_04915 [Candidatus Bathyarchaeota archaeon]|nr:MAG: hypothetical protein E4G67_04915 [Candidatus Bathyarchaeota archaeon]